MARPKIEDYAVNGIVPRNVYDADNDFYWLNGREVGREAYANMTPLSRLVAWDEDIGDDGIEKASKP